MIEWKHEKSLVDYKFAEMAMSRRVDDIIAKQKKELVWFLEHDNVFTLGTSAKTSDFKYDVNIPMYQTKRGGQTTYHGPGQRIVYMMLDLRNKKRDIDIGILWDNDYRLPEIFFNYLKENHKNLIIGDNQPYSGRLKNDTLYKHATINGLSNILIEIRQDLITEKKGQKYFANLVSKPLLSNKDNPILFKKSFYQSLAK